MVFYIENKMVVTVASSALFDTTAENMVFLEQGEDAYAAYQRAHEREPLKKGPAFDFIRRFLNLNQIAPDVQPVEVVLLSRSDAQTGLRVLNSIDHYGLNIIRAAFTKGKPPYDYLEAFNSLLFLSQNKRDVYEAVAKGYAAGYICGNAFADDENDPEFRIAFDFDGILADDAAEQYCLKAGFDDFFKEERENADKPCRQGPLKPFLDGICMLQKMERERRKNDIDYHPVLRVALATARNAPGHLRVMSTLRSWGVNVDETFFLGGIDKARVLKVFKPHIFFDDSPRNISTVAEVAPAVHIPFGVMNI
jgi:5'-nucleotidase